VTRPTPSSAPFQPASALFFLPVRCFYCSRTCFYCQCACSNSQGAVFLTSAHVRAARALLFCQCGGANQPVRCFFLPGGLFFPPVRRFYGPRMCFFCQCAGSGRQCEEYAQKCADIIICAGEISLRAGSARGLAHSGTLRAFRASPANASRRGLRLHPCAPFLPK
jgi:hypothetical protein